MEPAGMISNVSAVGVERYCGGRILAIKEGIVQPLIDASPVGRPSPSPSLLLERLDVTDARHQTHTLTDHVVTLFMQPAVLLHARKGSRASRMLVDAGQVVICVRNDTETVGWSEPISMLCACIGNDVIGEAARSLRKHSKFDLTPRQQANDPSLASLLWALEAERAHDYPSGRLFLDSIEMAIAALLVTAHSLGPATPASACGGLAPACLRRVLDFAHDHIGEQLGLRDLALTAGLSASHFSHQFRASMGISPYKYMLSLRIDRGKTLLKDKNMSILEIALAIGFESQQHFATVFRRVVGVTPSTYRDQL